MCLAVDFFSSFAMFYNYNTFEIYCSCLLLLCTTSLLLQQCILLWLYGARFLSTVYA